MNKDIWLVATGAILPAFLACVVATARGPVGGRLVAIQAASTITVCLLASLSFALDEASSIDLALALALISLPGTILFALFLERWT